MGVSKGEKKHKMMALVLNKEFGYEKTSISTLMKVSPTTIGNWVKEANYEVQINKLENQIEDLKLQLSDKGYLPLKPLEENILEYSVDWDSLEDE